MNNFPWTNRDWKRKRQNKRKWNNNRSGTVWWSVPTIGSVKATRAEPSWLMRIWKGRQLSPHIRLGLLWYLILPNFLFGDTKKKQYIIRWDAQGNFTNDILSVASKRKAFFLLYIERNVLVVKSSIVVSLVLAEYLNFRPAYRCPCMYQSIWGWGESTVIYQKGTKCAPRISTIPQKVSTFGKGEKWHVPEDPFSNISFRFGERRSARWSDVRVWQKSGSKREKIKVTKTSTPGWKMLSVFFLKFTE